MFNGALITVRGQNKFVSVNTVSHRDLALYTSKVTMCHRGTVPRDSSKGTPGPRRRRARRVFAAVERHLTGPEPRRLEGPRWAMPGIAVRFLCRPGGFSGARTNRIASTFLRYSSLATLRGPPEQAHVRGDLGPRPYRDPNPEPDATSHEGRAIVLSPFERAVPFLLV